MCVWLRVHKIHIVCQLKNILHAKDDLNPSSKKKNRIKRRKSRHKTTKDLFLYDVRLKFLSSFFLLFRRLWYQQKRRRKKLENFVLTLSWVWVHFFFDASKLFYARAPSELYAGRRWWWDSFNRSWKWERRRRKAIPDRPSISFQMYIKAIVNE